jgi:hypothetical protein
MLHFTPDSAPRPLRGALRGGHHTTRAARASWRPYGALRKGWLCGCAGAPAQNRCIEVIALAEKRIGEAVARHGLEGRVEQNENNRLSLEGYPFSTRRSRSSRSSALL